MKSWLWLDRELLAGLKSTMNTSDFLVESKQLVDEW